MDTEDTNFHHDGGRGPASRTHTKGLDGLEASQAQAKFCRESVCSSPEVEQEPPQASLDQTFQDRISFPYMPPLQPHLTIIALSLWLIAFLALACVVYAVISMWKENRFGWPLRGIIWFTLAIAGSCAVIALLAGYVQQAKSSDKASHSVEATTTQ